MVPVAAGIGHGESIELALGNFKDWASAREQTLQLAPGRDGEFFFEGHRGKPVTGSACGAGHGPCPHDGRAKKRAQLSKWDACGQTDCGKRPADLTNLLEQRLNAIRAYGDDQEPRPSYSSLQVFFRNDTIMCAQIPQLAGMAIVNDDRLPVLCQAEASQEGAGDASAAEEDDRPHANSRQAWPAASSRALMSCSVCAVEMIQWRPFEGVM